MSLKQLLLVVAITFSASLSASAQKEIEFRKQSWFGYFNQSRFSAHSGMWLDLQLRLNDYLSQKSLGIARLGYTYFVSDQLRLTAGYAYIRHYALNDQARDLPERRPWQQVQWLYSGKNIGLSQYVRVEERFVRQVLDNALTDRWRFSWRFRYNLAMSIPLKGKGIVPGTPFLFLNDEVHVNAGKNIINNYFDQNRLFAGLGYQFSKSLNAHLGYLYVFQQLPSGNEFIHINAVRLFVFHNLDMRAE